MSLLLGAFDCCECNKKIVSNYIITTGYFLFPIFSLFLFSCKEHCLHPNQCVLFTWDEPSANKEFVWFVKGSGNFITTDLSKVGNLEYQLLFL